MTCIPLPWHLLQVLWENPKEFPGQPRVGIVLPGDVYSTWNTSSGRNPGAASACFSHCGEAAAIFQAPQPILRKHVATSCKRKQILAICIKDHALSVMTQQSSIDKLRGVLSDWASFSLQRHSTTDRCCTNTSVDLLLQSSLTSEHTPIYLTL